MKTLALPLMMAMSLALAGAQACSEDPRGEPIGTGGSASGSGGSGGSAAGTAGGGTGAGAAAGAGGGSSGASGGGGDGGGSGSDAGGGAGSDAGGGGAVDCTGFVPKASSSDLAQSPRPNAVAEILAFETQGTLAAVETLYQRVDQELKQIVAAEPSLAGVTPISSVYSGKSLRLEFDASGWSSVSSGKYTAWECPNQAYSGSTTLNLQWSFAEVSFTGKRFHAGLIAAEYAPLPHVTSSMVDTYAYDGPDACLEIKGSEHFYIFDQASGDCPSGCMYHDYSGFSAEADAPVMKLGTYNPKVDAEPAWFAQLMDCRKRL